MRDRLVLLFLWATNGGVTLKTTLNQAFIINKLSIDVKPALNHAGKVVFEANPDQNLT